MKLVFNFTLIFIILCSSQVTKSEDYIKNYNVSTKGIKIGEIIWQLSKKEDKYEIKISLKSKGVLSSVYKFSGEYLSFGKVENNLFVPEYYTHEWVTKNKTKEMVILFSDNKIVSTAQNPAEKELPRVNLFNLKNYSDPLTSFINIFYNKDSSKTVDGRRVYKMTAEQNLEKPKAITITIKDYKNIYADHKRNDLEKIIFSKQSGSILPDSILIYFKGSVFKVYEN